MLYTSLSDRWSHWMPRLLRPLEWIEDDELVVALESIVIRSRPTLTQREVAKRQPPRRHCTGERSDPQ